MDLTYGPSLDDLLRRCPRCGAWLYVVEDPYEGEVLYCRYCGWREEGPCEEEYDL